MELKAAVTKDGIVFTMEDDDGEALEIGPVKGSGYKHFLAAVDELDDAVSNKSVGDVVLLARTEG